MGYGEDGGVSKGGRSAEEAVQSVILAGIVLPG